MSRTPLRAALTLTLLALASGCAAEGPATPTPSPTIPGPSSTAAATASAGPTTAAGTTAATPAATDPTEASPDALVVLRRSGGFAGRDDTVTVIPDGRWTAVDRAGTRRTGQLDATALDRLRRLAADPGLTAKRADDADGRCSDAFAYRLTVGGATVDWTECPPQGAPSPAAAELAALVVDAAVRP
ncbi:hypothetical protein [Micromonospora sp. DT233]|uniref:hypothetical protein n=1 Tax=Micromonospora sp. DT233 TaxID=3393432 RepID=UPI003CEC33C4